MKSFSEERKFMPERIEISLSLSDKYLFIKRRHGGYYIFSKKEGEERKRWIVVNKGGKRSKILI